MSWRYQKFLPNYYSIDVPSLVLPMICRVLSLFGCWNLFREEMKQA